MNPENTRVELAEKWGPGWTRRFEPSLLEQAAIGSPGQRNAALCRGCDHGRTPSTLPDPIRTVLGVVLALGKAAVLDKDAKFQCGSHRCELVKAVALRGVSEIADSLDDGDACTSMLRGRGNTVRLHIDRRDLAMVRA